MIKALSYRKQKPARFWLFPAIPVLTLLLVVLTPISAKAVGCCPGEPVTVAADPANSASWIASIGWLKDIFSAVNDTLSFFNNLLGPVTKTGFSSVAAAVTGSGMTNSSAIYNLGDFTAQTRDYTALKTGAGRDQVAATMSNKTSSCNVTQLEQDMEKMGGGYLGAAYTPAGSGQCHGTKANCGGPGYAYERTNDRCQLGLAMPGQYGSGYTCAAAPDQSYWNRDLNMDAFLNTYQMPLATPCILPDGYPSFSGPPSGSSLTCRGGASASATADTSDPTKSKLAWVAAYKFCERLQDETTSSPYIEGRSITSTDLAKIDLDLTQTLTRTSSRQACLNALWDRTACPADSDSTAQELGGGSNCHARQVKVCNSLKNDPNQNNDDVSGTNGTPVPPSGDVGRGFGDNPYLQNCDSNGLSPLMARYIKTHPCASGHWTDTVLPSVSRDTFAGEEFSLKTCPALDNYFRTELRAERAELIKLLENEGSRTGRLASAPASNQ